MPALSGMIQGKNAVEYENEGLATLGDSVLKAVIADKLYRDDKVRTKGEITIRKSNLENNDVMQAIMIKEEWIDYAYNSLHFHSDNNIPDHEQVSDKGHTPYIEAIVGAIYLDAGYDTTKRWIRNTLYPLLEHYSK